MPRVALLLLLVLSGCERPVAAVLTYAPVREADKTKAPQLVDVDRAVAVIQERLRRGSLRRRVSADDAGSVRVEAFTDDQAALDRIDRLVRASGTLEFRIVANAEDHAHLIELAEETKGREVCDEQGKLLGWWAPIKGSEKNGMLDLLTLTTRKVKRNGGVQVELLVANDSYKINGAYLTQVQPSVDEQGRPVLMFSLNRKGGLLMAGLTGENLPSPDGQQRRQLAIILNGQVHSAPAILSRISQHGVITGNFTQEEVNDLARILNSGVLPVALERVGVEHLNQGK